MTTIAEWLAERAREAQERAAVCTARKSVKTAAYYGGKAQAFEEALGWLLASAPPAGQGNGAIVEWLAEQEAAARGRANDQRPASSSEHWHRAQAAAYEAAHAYAIVRPLASAAEAKGFTCAARRQGSAAGNDPADCNWPVCGCDPHADKVIAALQESGLLASVPPAPTPEAKDLDASAAERIVSARLCADTDGYGSVDITLAGGLRVMLALGKPHAPTPDAGSDLAELSAAAAPGQWCAHLILEMSPADSDFCDALVNAYRSGRLVEASTSPPPGEDLAGQGEPVAERVPTGFERLVSKLVTDALYGGEQVPPHVEEAIERLEDALMQLVDADRAASATMEAGAMRLVAEALEHWSATFPKSHDIQGWLKQAIGALNYAREREAAFAELAAPAPSRPADREEIAKKAAEFRAQAKRLEGAGSCYSADLANAVADAYEDALALFAQALRDAPRTGGGGVPAPPPAGPHVVEVTNEDVEWLAREAIRTGSRTLARIAAALLVGRT